MAQVGEIVYQVQMDVAQLLTSQRQLDQRLRNMEGGFNRTTTAVNGTERSMSSLSRVAASLTAYLSVSAVASYAEAWTVLNNKLVNSIKAGETLAVVNQRVFDIAQNSRSSLDGIATLYSRLERAMRSAGLSGQELGQITTTISKAMTVSGATAAESEGALIQLSQALASGVLRGQEFNSMSEQAPALMKGLADSLGVSIGELRKMAGEGKLTTDVLLKAFREMGPTIEREFANTTQTMSQSLQIASNNITKFFGENTTVKTFTRIFNDSVVTISENLDYLTNILVIAAGVIGSRYAGALALAGAAQVKKARDTMAGAAASRQAAVAERDAATVLVRKTVADRDAAMSALNLARAEYQVARGSAAEATALANVTRLKTAYSNAAIIAAQANNTLSASQARVAATGLTMANALKAMNWLLAPIGGPAGAAMLAGAAVYYFFQKAEEAKRSAHEFADSLNELRSSMDKMSRAELAGKIADAKDKVDALTDAQREAEEEVKNLNTAYKAYSDGVWHFGSTQEKLETISRKLAKAEENLERVQNDRSKTVNFISAAQAKLNGELLQGEELLKREASTLLPNAAAALRAYGLDLDGATKAKQKFNAESLKVQWSDAGADMKKTLEREIEMAGAKNDVVKRQLQVKYYVEDKGISGQEAEKLDELAVKAGEASEAQRKNKNDSKDSSKAANTARDALKGQSDALARLNTGYREGSLEMAKYDAVKALGDKATESQIIASERLATAIHEVTQAQENQRKAEQGREYATGIINDSKSPLEQIEIESQAKLQKVAEFQALDLENTKLYEDAKTAIEESAAASRQKIYDEEAIKRTQAIGDILGAASQGFDGLAGIIKSSSGEANSAYRVLFGISKAFAVAQAALNLQTAISNAMAIPWPANIPAIAQATAAGAQITSAIGGINYGGGRYTGGPVSAGEMYRVGEGGKPEIFKASNGNQYMIPGDNGKVISNRDIGGGQVPVTVNINDYSSGGNRIDAQARQDSNGMTIDVFIADMDNKGPMHSAITRNTTASARVRG